MKEAGCTFPNSHQGGKGPIVAAQGRHYLPLHFANKLISHVSLCGPFLSFFLPCILSPLPAISLFLVSSLFYYLTRVRVRSRCFSLSSLCVSVLAPRCRCLSGMVRPVLIYSHHYLVSGEDKHAFACLMNQTAAVRPGREGARAHPLARGHLPPALQASVSLSMTRSHQLLATTEENMANT